MSYTITRLIYSAFLYLLLPLYLLISYIKCKHIKEFSTSRKCLLEKLGVIEESKQAHKCILLHAASVGETRSIFSILKLLTAIGEQVIVTNSSTQGAEQIYKYSKLRVKQGMAPYDAPIFVKALLKRLQPKCIVIVENEILPNMVHYAQKMKIPVILLNARLSDKSFKGYNKIKFFIKQVFNKFAIISIQNCNYQQKYLALGVLKNKIVYNGNLKFDVHIQKNLGIKIKTFIRNNPNIKTRLVWVAASTHKGEEELICKTHKTLVKEFKKKCLSLPLLILVPRHKKRFKEVGAIVSASKFNYILYSDLKKGIGTISDNTGIVLGDTMGELDFWYGVANVCFIAGSLLDFGGHNPLEAVIHKKPVISGKHYQDLEEIYKPFVDKHTISIIESWQELAKEMINIHNNKQSYQSKTEQAYQIYLKERGASVKNFNLIKQFI